MAQEQAKNHAVQRVRRLITVSLGSSLKNVSMNEKFIEGIEKLPMDFKNEASIKAIGDIGEFCNRLSRIGNMDYALGFFGKIADYELSRVQEELANPSDPRLRTYWIRPNSRDFPEEYLTQVNARFIVANFTDTVVKILGHLLFREKSIMSLKHRV